MSRSPTLRVRLRPAVCVLVASLVGCKGLDRVPILTADPCSFNGVDYTSREVYIARVLDGDTINTDTGESIRLLGINAPEIAHPDQAVECWGPESADWMTQKLTSQTVQLKFDAECTDLYGRTLAYVFASSAAISGSTTITSDSGTVVTTTTDTADTGDTGTIGTTSSSTYDLLINEESVREGQSIVFEAFDNIKLKSVLYDAQAVAQRENVGLWGAAGTTPECP